MIAPLAKLIDWSAIQVVWGIRVKSLLKLGPNPRLEETLQFLKGPNFIPAESPPARVEFTDPLRFRFPTPRPGEFVENNVVHGRLYRSAERWQKRPVIILLHGAGGDPDYHFQFPLMARHCNRAGFNAATLIAPFQFQRRPRQYGPVSILCQYVPLITLDYLQMAETYAQALAEIRSLNGWLMAEGCPAVALVGVSLGAYLAGLTGSGDARLAALVMVMPAARMGLLSSQVEPVGWRRVREAILRRRAVCEELDRTPLNLTSTGPAISRENVLLIEGMYDLMVSSSPVELWQSWGQPEIWRLPHGHISTALTALMPGLPGRLLHWLAPRLNNPAIRMQDK
jgi:pimeloyl-ACP methyl ester carboxylesterase